jgi:hypothetical protein
VTHEESVFFFKETRQILVLGYVTGMLWLAGGIETDPNPEGDIS